MKMKELGSGGGGGGGKRSESDKEKTKIRERQRRAITTNIFHGLRKHGGYRLSPRADINEVLRELAMEAGWIVEPDGTTYRSKIYSNSCPLCGAVKKTTTTNPTPTSSSAVISRGGGDCSTTESRHGGSVGDPLSNINGGSCSLLCFPESFSGTCQTISVPVYTYEELSRAVQSGNGGGRNSSDDGFVECSAMAMAMTYGQQGQVQHLEAVNMSNQSTTVGSPRRHL